jgi:nicotinamidase-related amidase
MPKDNALQWEDAMADLAAFVLAGRPERIDEGYLALAPPEMREGVRGVREALSLLAFAEPAATPASALRERIVKSVRARTPRRALVVIDMIRDHLEPGCLLEVPRARAIVPALQARLDDARKRGVPVIYVVDEHDADDPDLDAWGTHAVKGSGGTDVWPEIATQPGDRVVKKASYSSFFETELDAVLEDLGVDTLTLTGCLTEIGIMATATDALQRGFVVEVPPDAQAGAAEELERAALGTLSVMAPYGPARQKRLERLAQAA